MLGKECREQLHSLERKVEAGALLAAGQCAQGQLHIPSPSLCFLVSLLGCGGWGTRSPRLCEFPWSWIHMAAVKIVSRNFIVLALVSVPAFHQGWAQS